MRKIIHLVEILLKISFHTASRNLIKRFRNGLLKIFFAHFLRRVAFPPSCRSSPFFSRLRKEKKRRRWEYNEPFLVRLLRRSSYLLRAIPYPVDTKGDFPFFSSCFPSTFALLHYVPFHLPRSRSHLATFLSAVSYSARLYTQLQL